MQAFIMTLHNGVNDTFGSHADIKIVAIMTAVAITAIVISSIRTRTV